MSEAVLINVELEPGVLLRSGPVGPSQVITPGGTVETDPRAAWNAVQAMPHAPGEAALGDSYDEAAESGPYDGYSARDYVDAKYGWLVPESEEELIIGAVGLGGGKAATKAPSAVWKLAATQRGREIHRMLGENLPRSFPVVDKFVNGIVTSIKSVNLGAKTYQNAERLSKTLRKYIDKVARFNGGRHDNVEIAADQITGRSLQVAVPEGVATQAQLEVFEAAMAYGESVGVQVVVVGI